MERTKREKDKTQAETQINARAPQESMADRNTYRCVGVHSAVVVPAKSGGRLRAGDGHALVLCRQKQRTGQRESSIDFPNETTR